MVRDPRSRGDGVWQRTWEWVSTHEQSRPSVNKRYTLRSISNRSVRLYDFT